LFRSGTEFQIPAMPPQSPASNSTALLRVGVLSGWVLFTLMVIAISWTGSILRGRPSGLGGLLLWNIGWLFWAGGTFVVVRLSRRHPLERNHLLRGITRHVGFGIAVSVVLLLLEFFFNHGLELLWPDAPRANAFLGYIVYKFHVYFLIYWMILGATRAYDYRTQFRATELRASQLETRLAEAQLLALKAQLQPHFLFNTHHAIISLMLKQETTSAIRMLTRLSDLLRLTLRKTNDQFAALRDELDALELYLGIQRERYGARLIIQFEVEPAALTAEVPWLLLQPIVENALQHGIDALPAGGTLRLEVHTSGTGLCLNVFNDGPPLASNFNSPDHHGIGLRNTRARLARLYGDDHRFEIANAPSGGVVVHIRIPLRAFVPISATTATALSHA
jgi:two-component system LytT family sensor kinase